MKFHFLIPFVFITLFISCDKFDEVEQAEIDHELISTYVAMNNLNGQFTDSGLWYQVSVEGNGYKPESNSTVEVSYVGYLLDGTIFDQTDEEGYQFNLQAVILGWQEGMTYYSEGGEGKLIIPSGLGYGNTAVSTIPKNSVLVFDIHLLEVL